MTQHPQLAVAGSYLVAPAQKPWLLVSEAAILHTLVRSSRQVLKEIEIIESTN